VALLLAALLVSTAVPTAGPARAEVLATAASGGTPGVAVSIGPRDVVALPGYRRTPSGPVLDVARFTPVAALTLPASGDARTVVLSAQVTVTVPIRLALSVRAWCVSSGAMSGSTLEPDDRSLPDVLVIGQNPVPGRGTLQVASRTLTGRAVVDLPAGPSSRCVLQVSPRTEALTASRMRLVSGRFWAAPAVVPARAAQRPAVLVGRPGSPGSDGTAVAERRVAAIPPTVPAAAGIRVEGEAELTSCALGYHLCTRGSGASAEVDVGLELAESRADGTVCRRAAGPVRRVTITPAVHHVKVLAPALPYSTGCGSAVSAWLVVRHRGGNAVEVEPALTLGRVQTHTWIAAA
jgi:hypothetical protein